MTLDGRTVLVTGGCSGVGRGLATALASAGANVVLACRDGGATTAAELRRDGGRAIGVVCDVTRREDVAAAVRTAVERFGALHAVVHNATSDRSGEPTTLETVDPATFDDHIGVAVDGARWCALEAHPHLGRVLQVTAHASPARFAAGCVLVLDLATARPSSCVRASDESDSEIRTPDSQDTP